MKHRSYRSYCLSPLLMALSCASLLALVGCATGNGIIAQSDPQARRDGARQHQPGQSGTEVAQQEALMPVISAINSRIRANEQKIDAWRTLERKTATLSLPQENLNRIDECRAHLQHILLEYTALKRQLQQETQKEAARLLAGHSLLRLNQQDIEYLESGCAHFLAELETTSQPVVVAPPDPQIKAAYDSGDYGQVIRLYTQIATLPGQTLPTETSFQYGQALLKNHQEMEAKRVLTDLLMQMRNQQGEEELLLRLLQSLADLNFSMESLDEASKQYEELIRLSIEKGAYRDEWAGLQLAALQAISTGAPEFKEYASLLKNYLAFVPSRDGYGLVERADRFLLAYPRSLLAANVNLMKKSSREQTDNWLSQGAPRTETSIQPDGGNRLPEPSSQESASLSPPPVGPISPISPTSPHNEVIAPSSDPATTTRTPVAPVAPLPALAVTGVEKNVQEEYDQGMAHLQAKEYDKAIERFNRLQQTPLEAKARAQIEETSRLAAQDMRQKAAELFVRATKSRDTEERRKILLSSRDLLQAILVKYPQSGLMDKVQKNLARIEAELRSVGPGAMTRP